MYEIYRYLEPALNSTRAEESLEDWSASLLESLKANPEHYLRILQLFTHMTEEEIIKLSATEALSLFLKGLQENQILRFTSFMRDLAFTHGSNVGSRQANPLSSAR